MGHGVVEADLGDEHRRDAPTLLQQVDVQIPRLQRGSRDAQQHRVVDLTGRCHSEALHVSTRLGLLTIIGDARAPLVMRAHRALLRLHGLRVRFRGDPVVGVAVRLLGRALRVARRVIRLRRAGVGFEDDQLNACSGLIRGVGLRHQREFVPTFDMKHLTLDGDDREATLLPRGKHLGCDCKRIRQCGGQFHGVIEWNEIHL